MRDLLADLQSGGGDDHDATTSWSLEQLEKELAHLDQPVFAAPSAASLVVSHAQERAAAAVQSQTPFLSTAIPTSAPASGDAWSNSLERFTAMSLEHEFLAADSARKQNANVTMAPDFAHAEDYNISELVTLSPPPGLMAAAASAASPLRSPEVTDTSRQNMPLKEIAEEEEEETGDDDDNPAVVEQQVAALRALLHLPQPKVPPPDRYIPKPAPPTPQNSISSFPTQEAMDFYIGRPLPDPIPGIMAGPPTMVPAGAIPIAAATTPRPAWQTPPKPHFAHHVVMTPAPAPTLMPRVYCASHPSARPIPATALESKLMSARDIAYVVHSILKPILLLGTSESDYDIQYLRRCGDASSSGPTPTKLTDVQQDVQSRMVKAKDWSTKHSILGHVAKTNVTRPRALIATPTVVEHLENNSDQRDRANLWKARIYCDQGYQAYLALSNAWIASRSSGGSSAAGQPIQMHLKKLLKCFGTTPPLNAESDYTVVEPTALELMVKLDKGKILVARVIEQALLPPAAILALLPHLIKALLASPLSSSSSSSSMDVADDRVFRSLAFAIQTLPHLSPEALISSLQVVLQTDSQVALSSMARMECVHALLLRGSTLAAQSPPVNDTFAPEWGRLEGELMAILGG
jgi:hypothetical protein